MFRIIGAAAAIANLLWEFNIDDKKEDKLIKIKKGKVILVKKIVKSSLSEFSVKPGAIRNTNKGINISMIKTINNKPIKSRLNILFANSLDCFFPFSNSDE